MGLFGRKDKEDEGSDATTATIPDEYLAFIVKNLFDRYGDAIADMINRKVMQQLEPIQRRMEEMDTEIRKLKASSDETVKELLRSTLEVSMESVAEKASRKSIESIGLNKIELLNETLRNLKEYQIEFAENLEKVSKVLDSVKLTLNELSENVRDINLTVTNALTEMNKSLEKFRVRVDNAVAEAVKQIRENVVVDKDMIESVVRQILSSVVETKFREINTDVVALSNRVNALSRELSDLRGIEDSVNVLISKVEELIDKVDNLQQGNLVGGATNIPPIIEDETETEGEG